eukprot:maker-scaffold1010_size71100-snap-gene-0.1 protein:Tk12546 transcript:maker-scaffold1010_size71100-snap-gene-0.1-mRNA-1 annotation:"ureidoglycolate lyase"
MVYKIPFIISYLSQFMSLQPGDVISTGTPPGVGMGQKPPRYLKPGDFMSLQPGDVISTGTPPGVGMGQKPPRYLKPGDVVELGIDKLGSQRQDVINDH